MPTRKRSKEFVGAYSKNQLILRAYFEDIARIAREVSRQNSTLQEYRFALQRIRGRCNDIEDKTL